MTPSRPQLAPVLAALTDTDVAVWQEQLTPGVFALVTATDVGLFWVHADGSWLPTDSPGDVPLTVASVADAWEVLVARGLIPHGYAGRFVCWRCNGAGQFDGDTCMACDDGSYEHSQSLPDLVAWLSLGFAPSDDGTHPGILGAEELAASYGHPVAWEVTAPVLGIGSAYREGSVGERLLGAGIATWVSNGHLVLAVPPITDGRER